MPHWIVVTDIADPRRLRRVARMCERAGERVQESVFLLDLDADALKALQGTLARILDMAEDTVRYYPLCRLDLARSTGEGLCRGVAPLPAHWMI